VEYMDLKVGQIVEWTSQAAGTARTKRGVVAWTARAVVGQSWFNIGLPYLAAAERRKAATQINKLCDYTQRRYAGFVPSTGVLVRVERPSRRAGCISLKPWFYGPRVSALVLVR